MGRRNNASGLSGLAKFVSQAFPDSHSQSHEPASKKRRLDNPPNGSTQHTNSDVVPNADATESSTDNTVVSGSTQIGNGKGKSKEPALLWQDPSWISAYDATGTLGVSHYTHASEVPKNILKYFHQRFRLLSLYATPPGCLLDEEGWFSITPERIANRIAERCRCGVVLDAFCGVGGNAIAFAAVCERVIAMDTSPTRLALARHNAQIYGVADRIEFVLCDYVSFARNHHSRSSSSPTTEQGNKPTSAETRKIDVIFLSPPWGGIDYLTMTEDAPTTTTDETTTTTSKKRQRPETPAEHPKYPLSAIQPIHGAELFELSRNITPNVAYYLPRNVDLDEVGALLSRDDANKDEGPQEMIEVEEEWMSSKLKAVTCYFGGLVAGQEELF